jgi:hypothetical protein
MLTLAVVCNIATLDIRRNRYLWRLHYLAYRRATPSWQVAASSAVECSLLRTYEAARSVVMDRFLCHSPQFCVELRLQHEGRAC